MGYNLKNGNVLPAFVVSIFSIPDTDRAFITQLIAERGYVVVEEDDESGFTTSELEEELRLGHEDIAAGRVYTWEETMVAIKQAIKEGGEAYRKRNGQNA